jgi:hypothetical protein
MLFHIQNLIYSDGLIYRPIITEVILSKNKEIQIPKQDQQSASTILLFQPFHNGPFPQNVQVWF